MLRRLGLITAAGVALAGGIGYAAVKDSGSVIKACALKANGQLRLDTGDGCRPSEQAVQWNQTGPQGPPGNTDSTMRFASGFIVDGETAASDVLSGAGKLGTLSFTCAAVSYATNAADTSTFQDRVNFDSPQVPSSPFQVLENLTVPWPDGVNNRWFSMLIEGVTAPQTDVTLTSISGYVEYFPQFSGCSYYASMQTDYVRSPQTITP